MTPTWPRRRLQELLGLTHPILQAPMAGAVGPEMAAAVTAAGGLGGVPAGTVSDDRLVADLSAARALVGGPYNVNCFLHQAPAAPSAADVELATSRLAPLYRRVGADAPAPRDPLPRFEDPRLRAILDLRPAAASFHFGLPNAAAMDALRAAGIVLMASATTVDEAIDLVARGIDVVIAQGAEAGGHRGGAGLVGTMALVPQIVDAVEVPVVAAGGIADGRGVAAALALGADGVQIGTALLQTPEATMDTDQRTRLARARAEDTVITRGVTGRPARGLRNPLTEDVEVAAAALAYPLQISMTRPTQADPELRAVWSGQTAPLARDEAAGRTVTRLAEETLATLRGLAPG